MPPRKGPKVQSKLDLPHLAGLCCRARPALDRDLLTQPKWGRPHGRPEFRRTAGDSLSAPVLKRLLLEVGGTVGNQDALSPSLCLSLSLSLCLSPSLCISPSLSSSLSLLSSFCQSLFVSLCLSLSVSVYVSSSLSHCPCVLLHFFLCLSLCISISASLYDSVSVSMCLCVFLCLCLSAYSSVSISVSGSLSLLSSPPQIPRCWAHSVQWNISKKSGAGASLWQSSCKQRVLVQELPFQGDYVHPLQYRIKISAQESGVTQK